MTVDEIDEGMRIEGPKSDPLEPLPEQGVDLERGSSTLLSLSISSTVLGCPST